MQIKDVFITALEIIAEFKEQTSKIIGARAFLEEYEETLQSGLSRMDHLDTYGLWLIFEAASEILEIVAEETEKLTSFGSSLKVAIIRGLQRDIGVAMKGLED